MSSQPIASAAVVEGQLLSTTVQGESVIVTRVGGVLKAYSGKCPHLGLPLSKGNVQNGTVTCKFHGAEFDLATGQNVKWVDSVLKVAAAESADISFCASSSCACAKKRIICIPLWCCDKEKASFGPVFPRPR